jgi:hypothetical protein
VKRAIIENELGIIDSHSQHQVLRLRWYIPLLSTSFNDIQPNSPQMITVVWIKLVASYIMNTDTIFSRNITPQTLSTAETLNLHPDLWYFSSNRRDKLKVFTSILLHIHALLKTVSNLPDIRYTVALKLSPAIVPELLINDVWFPISDPRPIKPKAYKQVLVKNIYIYDKNAQRLKFRTSNDLLKKFPLFDKRLYTNLGRETVQMFRFSLQSCIPVDRTHPQPLGSITSTLISSTYQHTLEIHKITRQVYRKAVLSATPTKSLTVSRVKAGS